MLGQISACVLVVISVFRYIIICKPQISIKMHKLSCFELRLYLFLFFFCYLFYKEYRLTPRLCSFCIIGAIAYALIWTVTPFLGWSSYTYEPFRTSCSFDWYNDTSFFFLLLHHPYSRYLKLNLSHQEILFLFFLGTIKALEESHTSTVLNWIATQFFKNLIYGIIFLSCSLCQQHASFVMLFHWAQWVGVITRFINAYRNLNSIHKPLRQQIPMLM